MRREEVEKRHEVACVVEHLSSLCTHTPKRDAAHENSVGFAKLLRVYKVAFREEVAISIKHEE